MAENDRKGSKAPKTKKNVKIALSRSSTKVLYSSRMKRAEKFSLEILCHDRLDMEQPDFTIFRLFSAVAR